MTRLIALETNDASFHTGWVGGPFFFRSRIVLKRGLRNILPKGGLFMVLIETVWIAMTFRLVKIKCALWVHAKRMKFLV